MNYPVYTTQTLLLDKYQAESSLLCMVHTLFFHRMIYKSVRPKEMAHPIFESLYYVMIDDPILHETVVDKIKNTLETLKERPIGTVSIIFYKIKSGNWFSKNEQIEIERWNIPVQWYEQYDQSHTRHSKEQRVLVVYESFLSKLSSIPIPIYQVVNDYLPFDIVDSDKSNSFKDILQFIMSGPPKLNIF